MTTFKTIRLTKPIVDKVVPREIIYAEVAGGGAMGNEGGIIMYLIEDGALTRYETNVFIDEKIYMQAQSLILNHQSIIKGTDLQLKEVFFDHFYGGFGNWAFINKDITLEIGDLYFIYKKGGEEYKILPSSQGVFHEIVDKMQNQGKYFFL